MAITTKDFPMHKLKAGRVTEAIESQTAKIPTVFFLGCAVGAMIGAAALQATGRKSLASFVGQWAPTFLILGLYNKLVKLHGHGDED